LNFVSKIYFKCHEMSMNACWVWIWKTWDVSKIHHPILLDVIPGRSVLWCGVLACCLFCWCKILESCHDLDCAMQSWMHTSILCWLLAVAGCDCWWWFCWAWSSAPRTCPAPPQVACPAPAWCLACSSLPALHLPGAWLASGSTWPCLSDHAC
jgi:hypothetical protein